MTDAAIWGSMRWNYFRWGVVNPSRYEKIGRTKSDGGLGTDVSRWRRSVGEWKDVDATTGWLPETYAETTITGILSRLGGSSTLLPAGAYIQYDAVFWTVDGVSHWDVLEESGVDDTFYYRVESVENKYDDDGGFAYRLCQLKRLPLFKP